MLSGSTRQALSLQPAHRGTGLSSMWQSGTKQAGGPGRSGGMAAALGRLVENGWGCVSMHRHVFVCTYVCLRGFVSVLKAWQGWGKAVSCSRLVLPALRFLCFLPVAFGKWSLSRCGLRPVRLGAERVRPSSSSGHEKPGAKKY